MTKGKRDDRYLEKLLEVNTLIQSDRGTEALERAEEMMHESPDDPAAFFMIGLYAFSQGNLGDAINLFNKAHQFDPECMEYADCLAVLYTVTGKLADGLYFAKLSTALESDPDIRPYIPNQMSNYFEAFDRIEPTQHYVNGLLLFNAGRFDEAVRSCELELKQNENHDLCYALLGNCHLRLGNYDKAVNALHAAINLNPDNAEYASLLGSALCHLGRFDEAFVCHGVALDREPESLDCATAALSDADCLADSLEPVRAGLREELKRRIDAQPTSELDVQHGRIEKDRIRIGYVSNALYDSEQGRFIQALLANHDHGRFEIFCYQQSIAKDSVQVELQNATESWREIFDIQDPVVELIMKADEIDVVVDLCGYTADNRVGLIANRPAPVQIAWLEPPHGIRVPGIDVVVSDPVTHEWDLAAASEEQGVVRLETGLLALEPFTFYPEVDDLPATATGHLTFGGQCELSRLTPETAANWSRVLAATGRSKLLLGDVGAISGAVKNSVIDLFSHFGVADRIAFMDEGPDDHVKIEFFRQIDVLLDTYPVSGRLNVCKALWMGVPVITLKGPRRTSQTAASILHSAGQAAWICDSVEGMTELAASFAEDLDGLAKIRQGLRDAVAESDLFSPRKLVAALESVYAASLELRRKRDGKATGRTGKPRRGGKAPRKAGKTARKAAPKASARKAKGPARKAKRRK